MKECLKTSGVNPLNVKGIAFDATCSLVALGDQNKPVSVALSGESNRNIILWMDHRVKIHFYPFDYSQFYCFFLFFFFFY